MATQKQIDANKRNAKKSTGPKTPQGKAKSAQNATRHGLTATTDVIKGESQEECDAFKQALLDELAPKTMIQEILADRVVSLAWRMKRSRHMHNQLVNALIADRNIRQEIWRSTPYPCTQDPNLTLGSALKVDLYDKKALDRFVLYDRRTENSFLKCVNELDRRKRKNPSEPECAPSLSRPTSRDLNDPQMEPTRAHTFETTAKKQTQIANLDAAATTSCKDTYNLCPRGSGANPVTPRKRSQENKANVETGKTRRQFAHLRIYSFTLPPLLKPLVRPHTPRLYWCPNEPDKLEKLICST